MRYMKTFKKNLALTAITATVMTFIGLTFALPAQAAEPEPTSTITNFTINATIDDNKKLSVEEKFTYNFVDNKTTEIYREFRLKNLLKDRPQITVTVDGVPFEDTQIINQKDAWDILVIPNKEGWTGSHEFTIAYTATINVDEIKRNATIDDESIKKNTAQYFKWEALIPLWKAPIADFTVNLTVPNTVSFIEFYNNTEETPTKPNIVSQNETSTTYTYAKQNLPANSNGLVVLVQYDKYLFTEPNMVGKEIKAPVVKKDEPKKAPEENKTPTFIFSGVLVVIAVAGLIYKFKKRKK